MPLLILGPWLLPESEPDASGPLDPLSILQSMVALGALVYGIKHVAGEGVNSLAMTAFVVGAASGWLFVRRQLRLPVPVMDLALFRNKTFSGSVVINLMSLAFLIGFVFSPRSSCKSFCVCLRSMPAWHWCLDKSWRLS